MKKVTPFLWFEVFNIKEVFSYYQSIFGGNITCENLESIDNTPSGTVQTAVFNLFDQRLFVMTAGKHHSFNDSFSLMINCKDQEEIDLYWNAITKEGQASECGWCIDKYGLRFQIVPENLGQLTSTKEGVAKMLTMKKIVIADF
jgi:predicted 3-demethylubiquinone-9 3-methyltransferase (glyoxalase superfamily)